MTDEIINSLKKLEVTAKKAGDTPFREGYLMAIRHAIELAERIR